MCPNNPLGTVDLLFASSHGAIASGSLPFVHGLRPRVVLIQNGTRKGAAPDPVKTILSSPGLEGLWQMHWSYNLGVDENAPGLFIANVDDAATIANILTAPPRGGGPGTAPAGAAPASAPAAGTSAATPTAAAPAAGAPPRLRRPHRLRRQPPRRLRLGVGRLPPLRPRVDGVEETQRGIRLRPGSRSPRQPTEALRSRTRGMGSARPTRSSDEGSGCLPLTIERNHGYASFVYRKEDVATDGETSSRARSTCSCSRRCSSSRCTDGASPSDRAVVGERAAARPGHALSRAVPARTAGLIRSEWKVTENNRRARYYALTREGRRHFSDELAQWRRMSRAVNLVLEATMTSS